ncbi:hypothetical protein [Streptomyces camelliae]|uniref:hypothetical protein n=1 Tax=Streptomyces camelliae TaxID=3004093 RepID=UPI002FD7C8FB
MGSLRLTLCTGILAAAALTPSAHAVEGGSVDVTPGSPAPGTDVSLRVHGCSGPEGTAVSTAFVADARLTGRQGTLSGETRVRSSLAPGTYDVRVTCADFVFNSRLTIPDRGIGAGRGMDQGVGRGADHGMDPASGRGTDQATGRGSDQGAGRGMDSTSGRGTDQGAGRGADHGTDPASGRGTDQRTGPADQPDPRPDAAASPFAPVHAGGGGTATHFATVATSESGPGTAQTLTGLGLAGIAALAVGLRAHRSRNGRDSGTPR